MKTGRFSFQLISTSRWLIFFSLGLLVSSCSQENKTPTQGQGNAAPVPVQVAQARTEDVPVEIRAIGNVQAYSTVAIRSQITGPIMQVHFREGQEVKVGDLLFTIDPRPWEALVNQAQANAKRDEANLLSARLEFMRTSNLFISKIASQDDFDKAEAAFRSLEATVLSDNAAISNAQVSLDYTSIRSPVDGRTGSLAVKAGNVVKAPDDVLVTITQIRPIYVGFAVPERQLPTIRQRAREAVLLVKAFAPGETNNIAIGELTFIDNTVDTNTGTIFLKGTFANTNDVLWPGQFVQTSLTVNTLTQATLVPAQAVQMGQNGEYIFVVKPDSTVEVRTNIVTGGSYEGQTVIISGVQPDETIVTDGQLKLTPGAKVAVKAPDAKSSSTNTVLATP
jgi:multidrug efflux system membrane fusion protein